MKKVLSFVATTSFVVGLSAQSLVGTDPTTRNAVIEDYTGMYCTWCPEGALVSDGIKAKYPGRVVAVGVHSGGYANDNSASYGVPYTDFRTSMGSVYNGFAAPSGYPNGSVNRIGKAMGRGSWEGVCQSVIAQSSIVNVGAEAYYHPGDQEITINVEVYYTASASANQFLNVFILQDNIIAGQVGKEKYPGKVVGSLYRHDDVLRATTTGVLGEQISATAMGDLTSKTYTWKLDDAPKNTATNAFLVTPVIEDLKVVVFVTNGDNYSEITTAIEVKAEERPTGINETKALNDLNIFPNPFETNATIAFSLDKSTPLNIAIYDVAGKLVQQVANSTFAAGNQVINIDGANLKAGVYNVRIVAEDGIMNKKVVLNK